MWISRLARVTLAAFLAAFLAAACASHAPAAPATPATTVQVAAPTEQLATSGGVQASAPALPIVASDDPVWGAANAPVTIVEFSDLQCPFCSRVHPTIKALQAKYGLSQLRVAFKHRPLDFHEHALPAAKVADAVFRQGGSVAFFAFLDVAFASQMELSDAALPAWVTRVGLDAASVLQRAQLPATSEKIARDIALADRVGANGTPAFRINGRSLSGAQPLESFTEVVDAELIAAAELRKRGTPAEGVYPARVAANFVAPSAKQADDEDEEDLEVWAVPVKGAPAIGPADALVTIVEFFDYQCPYCRRVEPTMDELLKRYPKDVRLVLRQNPLPFHPRAVPAANLALEARAQKGDVGFFEANRKLLEGNLEDEDLLKIGRDLKLDEKRLRAAITKNTHSAELEADVDVASSFKAAGTPHFFVNGVRLSGAQPLENFVKLVDTQLQVANALVAAGTPRANVYAEVLKHAKAPTPPETRQAPAVTAENPTRGPANAPVTIHVFSDFQCPFCSRVEPTLAELEKAYPGKLRWVWHDLPLAFHANARPAAIVAREVRAQKGDAAFWKIHDMLFRDQGDDTAFSDTKFNQYATELRLDIARFNLARTDGRHDSALQHDKVITDATGIRGTPAFLINGYYVSGAQPLSVFKSAVRRALASISNLPKLSAAAAKP